MLGIKMTCMALSMWVANIYWIITLSTTKVTTPLQLHYLPIYFPKNAKTDAPTDRGAAGQEQQGNTLPKQREKSRIAITLQQLLLNYF